MILTHRIPASGSLLLASGFLLLTSCFAQEPAPAAPQSAPTQAPEPEYRGPAILSRGGGPGFGLPLARIKLRPFLSLTGNYDSGITPIVITPNGQLLSDHSLGGSIGVGVSSYVPGRKSLFMMDYRGGYNHYTQNTYYNGSEQVMQLGYSRQATRRVSFSLRESAGTYDRGFYGGFETIGYVDPTFANVPSQELFDSRVYYLNTLGDMTYHKSARMSFNFGGDGFLIRRRSTAFYGTTGYRARGDAVYRVNRRTSSGVAYDFTHYEYTKAFGASDIHSVSLVESFQLGRRAELSLRVGAYRIETLGATSVTFEPAIAAIIGVASGVEVLYRINYVPSVSSSITWGFRKSTLSLSYQRGVTPGNGVYLTSRTTAGTVSYSYSGIRRWAFNLNGGYDSLGSLTRNIGNYNAYRVSTGASYDAGRGVHLVSSLDFRHYTIESTNYARVPLRVSVGLSFAPGEVPLRFW